MIKYTSILHSFRRYHKLSLSEYTICDMIHFLSCNKNNPFFGWCSESKTEIAEEIGLSRQSVHTLIKKLIQEGFVIQEESRGFLQTTKKWDEVYLEESKCKETLQSVKKESVKKLDKDVKKLDTECKETLQDTYIYKESKETKKEEKQKTLSIFPEESPDRKTLFSNSKLNDFDFFEKQFKEPEFQSVDLHYYFHSVLNWSDKSNTKRTLRGWIATAKDFMKGDNQKGKLVKLKELNGNGMDPDLIDYLKM